MLAFRPPRSSRRSAPRPERARRLRRAGAGQKPRADSTLHDCRREDERRSRRGPSSRERVRRHRIRMTRSPRRSVRSPLRSTAWPRRRAHRPCASTDADRRLPDRRYRPQRRARHRDRRRRSSCSACRLPCGRPANCGRRARRSRRRPPPSDEDAASSGSVVSCAPRLPRNPPVLRPQRLCGIFPARLRAVTLTLAPAPAASRAPSTGPLRV